MSVFAPEVFLKPALGAGRHKVSREVSFPFRNPRWTDESPRSIVHCRGAKKVGLHYERRVLDVLSAIYGDKFLPSPVIRYDVGRQSKAAIPDGVLRIGGWVVVIEIKLSHTERVWGQLMERYAPLVRALEPGATVRTVEICRYYNPDLPIPHTLTQSLHRPAAGGLEVLQWKL